MGVLNDYKASRYKGWVDSMEALDSTMLQARLDNPLMKRMERSAATEEVLLGATPVLNKGKDSLLECNFDRGLLAMFSEVQYWEKFQGEFSIPYVAHDICNQREKLRVMREHVMLIVRAYNAILYDLTVEERRLFSDHIRKLDKRINQGLQKLTWATKGVVEHYVKDCCNHCGEIHAIVRRYKEGKHKISRECRLTASLLLLRIDKNAIYDEGIFEAKQANHRTEVKRRFQQSHQNIKQELRDMFVNFREGTSEVQREWRELVKEVDREVEVSLRQTVKRSLQELSRAINGDAKSEPQTLFGVKIVLENSRIDYRPTMINLTHVVNIVAKELISTVAVVPRLREVLVAETEKPPAHATTNTDEDDGVVRSERHPSFYSVISNDEDMLKIVVQIMNGMSSTATELQKYLGRAIRVESHCCYSCHSCTSASSFDDVRAGTGRNISPYGRWTRKPTSDVMPRQTEV
jgi:dynein heavy chain